MTVRRALLCFAIGSLLGAGVLADTTAAPSGELPPNRAYAVRSEKLSIINQDTFESLGEIPLPDGKAIHRWSNAEGTRLALILQAGLLGNLPVHLVVIDLESDTVVKSIKLGYDVERFLKSDDGNRAYLILGGKFFRGKTSVVAIETNSGTILAQHEIKKQPTDFLLNENGDELIFVHKGLNALKANQRRPASIQTFDATSLEPRKKFELPGPIRGLYLDYPGRLYFMNPGVDHKSDKSRAQGEVYVYDRQSLERIDTLEVGMAPGRLAWDSELERFYLLTSPYATQKQAKAQLHLIDGDGLAASVDLPRRPLGAQPSLDREHFYVLYEDDVVRVDRNLEQSKKALSLKDSPVALFEHPESGHFYALHYDSAYISVVDGAAGKAVDRLKSGRDKKRIAKLATAAGAQVAMAGLVVATGPSYTVNDTAYYRVPIVNPVGLGSEKQWTFGNFSETADYLYVFNSWTNDVTVIDTATHKIVKKVVGGEYGLQTLDNGRLLCTASAGAVRLFDATAGFEMAAKYDGVDGEIVEIPGTRKAYLSRGLGDAVAVIDLDKFGEPTSIEGTAGWVVPLDHRD